MLLRHKQQVMGVGLWQIRETVVSVGSGDFGDCNHNGAGDD